MKRIGEFATALEIVNQSLSNTIAAMASGRGDGDTKSSGLILAGNEILEAYKVVGGSRLRYALLLLLLQLILAFCIRHATDLCVHLLNFGD